MSGGNRGQHEEEVDELQGDIGLSDTLKEQCQIDYSLFCECRLRAMKPTMRRR